MTEYEECKLCPRECRVNRNENTGFCKSGVKAKVARAALHFWEEPCISGENGSGAVFFSSCTLGCSYCQNYKISHKNFGKEISDKRLSELFLELQEKDANNINLVTATHFLPNVISALDMIKGKLKIPVVYNCGGYEKSETIEKLKNYVDIFLTDIKYFDEDLGKKYSYAPNYFSVASSAAKQMIVQVGKPLFDENKMLKKGVIIRHLVLPSHRHDSIKILHWIAENLPKDSFLLSIMSQYTPFYKSSEHKEINRRITGFEYSSVVEEAVRLGLITGFMQERSSAKEEYTPPFDEESIKHL